MKKNVDPAKQIKGEGTRRHKGEGTIYQRADGKWCAQVSSGRDEHGKRLRRSVIGDTPEDVIKKKQELEHALNADEYVEKNRIGKPIINTLFHTGLRIGEAIALDWNDLHFNDIHPLISIDKAVTLEYEVDEFGKPGAAKTVRALPKSETSIRFVPMDSQLMNILLEWRDQYCKKFNCKPNERDFGKKLVFPNRYGVLRSYSSFRRQFIRFLEKQCLSAYQVTFHRFRHTFATLLIQKGVDARTVQELLGHADVETTLKEYRDVTDGDKRRASDIVEGVFSTLGSTTVDDDSVQAG